MSAFDALYKNTVTLFNRHEYGDDIIWIPLVLHNVHLVVDKANIIATYGERATDNARLHVRYGGTKEMPVIEGKTYLTPMKYREQEIQEDYLTFAYGEDFDFFIEGEWADINDYPEHIHDSDFNNGFYDYMNKHYDNVFAITGVSKFNLIPHFEITAR